MTYVPLWTKEKPLREVDCANYGKALCDIESHMPRYHVYRESDKVTWSHETTHGLNSLLRNKHNVASALYMLNNNAFLFADHPKTTLEHISRLTTYKGGVYNLYLIQQQQYWNKQPLYVLDEWVSYINGSITGLELNLNRGESIEYALEFNFYAQALIEAVEQDDSNYSDLDILANFIGWCVGLTFELFNEAIGTNMEKPIHDQLVLQFSNPDSGNVMSIPPTPGTMCGNHLEFSRN